MSFSIVPMQEMTCVRGVGVPFPIKPVGFSMTYLGCLKDNRVVF